MTATVAHYLRHGCRSLLAVGSDASVICGPGLTLTTLKQSGGSVTVYAGLTTVQQTDAWPTVPEAIRAGILAMIRAVDA